MHTIDVFHREYQASMDQWNYEFVATVSVPEGLTVEDGLEYAYRWTQNIEGSWSRKIGPDANTNVAVYMTKMVNGNVMGLRSSMVGDLFVVDSDLDQQYEVGVFGFQPYNKSR